MIISQYRLKEDEEGNFTYIVTRLEKIISDDADGLCCEESTIRSGQGGACNTKLSEFYITSALLVPPGNDGSTQSAARGLLSAIENRRTLPMIMVMQDRF